MPVQDKSHSPLARAHGLRWCCGALVLWCFGASDTLTLRTNPVRTRHHPGATLPHRKRCNRLLLDERTSQPATERALLTARRCSRPCLFFSGRGLWVTTLANPVSCLDKISFSAVVVVYYTNCSLLHLLLRDRHPVWRGRDISASRGKSKRRFSAAEGRQLVAKDLFVRESVRNNLNNLS